MISKVSCPRRLARGSWQICARKGVHLVVTGAELDPVRDGGLPVLGLPPADHHVALGPVDAEVTVELLVDAPGEVDVADYACLGSDEDLDRVFDLET